MPEKRRLPMIFWIVPVVFVAMALIFWLVVAMIFRGPLQGDSSHDFGPVAIPASGPAILSHTFELSNPTRAPIIIQSARPDCGCLRINATFPLTIAPGQTVSLPITMTYQGTSGAKKVTISLDCGDAGLQVLRVTAQPG